MLNIRFPSLKFNTDRRFCYIQFTSEQAALDAVARFNGKVLKDSQGKEYRLVAKISNPEKDLNVLMKAGNFSLEI